MDGVQLEETPLTWRWRSTTSRCQTQTDVRRRHITGDVGDAVLYRDVTMIDVQFPNSIETISHHVCYF